MYVFERHFSLIRKKNRLMRSPCCRCVCFLFQFLNQVLTEFGTNIMPLETIPDAYLLILMVGNNNMAGRLTCKAAASVSPPDIRL
jgi:hypothetical protein